MHAFFKRQRILQCQNNELQDPFNKLPPELLCKIFRKIPTSSITKAEEVVVLVSICKRWREIILGDPIFWTTLRIPYFADNRFGAEQIKRWLALSNRLPLSIVFNQRNHKTHRGFRFRKGEILDVFHIRKNPRRALKVIVDMVMAEKDRIRGVDATYLKGFLERMVQTLEPTTTTPHAAWSKLTYIAIDTRCHVEYVIELLQRCPQIEHLRTRYILRSRGSGPQSELETMKARGRFIRLPHLKIWTVSFAGRDDGVYPAALFDHLETPALEEVTYKSRGDSTLSLSALEKLFQHSACVITTLRIQFATFTRESLVSLLRSQPSLVWVTTELHPSEGTMHAQSWEEVQAAFDAFKGVIQLLVADREAEMTMDVGENITEGGFLPNLETFEHIGEMHYPWDDLADLYDVMRP